MNVKLVSRLPIFLLFLAATLAAQTKTERRDQAELIRLTNELSRASVAKDAATLRRLMDERFYLVGVSGKIFDKKTLIEIWTEKNDDPETTESSVPGDIEVRLFGDTAIVLSTITDTVHERNRETIVQTKAFDVWKKTKKGWRWIASRETLVSPDKPQ